MEDINRSDLKAILHSKRANIYYLEKCRVMQKDGRIVYLTDGKKRVFIGIFLLQIRQLLC